MANISSVAKSYSSEKNINLLSLSVVRRDGSITPFKSYKISNAIKKPSLPKLKLETTKKKIKSKKTLFIKLLMNLPKRLS